MPHLVQTFFLRGNSIGSIIDIDVDIDTEYEVSGSYHPQTNEEPEELPEITIKNQTIFGEPIPNWFRKLSGFPEEEEMINLCSVDYIDNRFKFMQNDSEPQERVDD